MKILHIIDSGGLYGAETVLLHLMAEQVRMGLQPILASIGAPGISEKPLEVETRQRGFAVIPFRMRSGPNWAGALSILRYARQEQINVLHSHGYKGNILFGLLPKGIRGLPLVSTLHGWTSVSGLSRLRLYEWLETISLRFVDRVVLVNEAMRTHPRLVGLSSKKLTVVENGIQEKRESGVLQPAIREFCRRRYTIGAIGRLSPEKGFDILLDTLADLLAADNDIQLVILGEGQQRSRLEEKVRKLQLEDRVLLPGFIAEAQNYLPLFNAFVISSLTEGLPMVLLEAMAAGTPIAATSVGGIPQALGEGQGGCLVKAGEVESLKQAMMSIMRDVQTAEKRAAWAARCVREKYSCHAMAEKYRNIYQALIK